MSASISWLFYLQVVWNIGKIFERHLVEKYRTKGFVAGRHFLDNAH